jgi:hypothetical protein
MSKKVHTEKTPLLKEDTNSVGVVDELTNGSSSKNPKKISIVQKGR